jgi:hypothetical protein
MFGDSLNYLIQKPLLRARNPLLLMLLPINQLLPFTYTNRRLLSFIFIGLIRLLRVGGRVLHVIVGVCLGERLDLLI